MTWTHHNLFFSLTHKDILEFFIKCFHGVCRCAVDCMVFIYQPDGPLDLFSASSYRNNEFLLFPLVSSVHRQQDNDPDGEQTWKEDRLPLNIFLTRIGRETIKDSETHVWLFYGKFTPTGEEGCEMSVNQGFWPLKDTCKMVKNHLRRHGSGGMEVTKGDQHKWCWRSQ